jgi:ectoine hydroxylase-related dioxygenase (phytanoyl-CoA dioxygenase family)
MMRVRRAPSETAGFDEAGYVVLESLVGDNELAVLRDEVAAVLQRPLPAGCERPHNTLAPLRWNDPLVLRTLSRPEMLHRITGAVSATDPRWISGYVSVKGPRSPALSWHQDWWCWSHPVTFEPTAPQLAVLLYLDDTDAQRGALRVIPGSHRRSLPLHGRLREIETTEIGLKHPAMSDHGAQVTLSVSAGDAVVLDYRLLHGTHPKTATGSAAASSSTLRPAGATCRARSALT